jgi:hypothetical protein
MGVGSIISGACISPVSSGGVTTGGAILIGVCSVGFD